ncbi:MAG: RecQ family ATP-dependent DNA helicase, partial [Clostridium sp.]|uniref:RecQ family ATP-dependent DNA helicase n=1 Tax=Clostridium sp. TaxID=1506 RepID=UPI003EE6E9C3
MNIREKAHYALKKFYGYDTFKEGQLEVIEKIINKSDVFCLLPTGGGKSVCYQIPSIILSGITIVISPLISLMKDQVDNLKELGLKGAFINSSINTEKMKEILNDAALGEYKILYIAPERLESDYFRRMIKGLDISHIAVDEAHCVSEWGHDFRKSYRKIKVFCDELDKRPVISAFTATATKEVMEDSIKLLSLNHPYIYKGNINRNNLRIKILKEIDKEEVTHIIREHEAESGIIYCASRKEVDELYSVLRDIGFSVLKYHGGM